jgi:basic membrane protein A and related proteins
MRRIRIISALSALALATGTLAASAAEKPVALIIAQGGLGDQSYNDLAYSGFKKALSENKLEGKAVESKDVVAQAADILRRASDAGFGLSSISNIHTVTRSQLSLKTTRTPTMSFSIR